MSWQIHWHEGLFLQPQHLQVMQRGLLETSRGVHRLGWHYPYGVVEARLLPDALGNGLIRFEKLHVLMRSGVEVLAPDLTELPTLDINPVLAQSTGSFDIYLGVPLWKPGGANASGPVEEEPEEGEVRPRPDVGKIHYRIRRTPHADENSGLNPKDIDVRMVNAQLQLKLDQADMESLPILRVQRASDRANDAPRPDPDFVPPCLVLGGSPTLRRLATELAAKITSNRDELAPKLTRGGLSADLRLELILRLRTLGHFAGILPGLAESPWTPPFELYQQWCALLGELAALQPGSVEARPPRYRHDDPLGAFKELDLRIRRALVERRGNVVELPFKPNANGQLQIELTEDYLTKPTGYYLGIKTRLDRTYLMTYVTDGSKFKLMPASLSGAAVFGVKLNEESAPPHELPMESRLYFLSVALKESQRWNAFQADRAAVLEWNTTQIDLSDASFSLYLTMPT